jgi:ribosomal protein S18 acetylase RimI-like enzyme
VPRPDTLYLHDLAVLPGLAGQGLGRALLETAWRSALGRGLAQSALVAVPGAQGFWERRGYAVHALRDADQRERLAGYGEGARYMLRRLTGASGPPASSG